MKTTVQILDLSLNVITEVKALKPFGDEQRVLQYSKELSQWGQCRFRISMEDELFDRFGDILIPHKNHVRILKGSNIVWQGAIVDNPERNKEYIDVLAFTYEFYLYKNMIKRTSADINGTTNIYRIFKSGNMAAAVTELVNEVITDFAGGTHILKNLSVGTIENPDYPAGLTSDFDGTALTGGWVFGDGTTTAKGPSLQYDFHTVFYVLRMFGIYTNADFEIDENLKFHFKKFLGSKEYWNLSFTYGNQGNIIDYGAPRLGQRMMNSVVAIATDPFGIILHKDQANSTSISNYGLLEGVAAYDDVKGQGILDTRSTAEFKFVTTPDESNIIIYLNENSYPLGMYDVGDLCKVVIKDKGINVDQIRRIVGYTVTQNKTSNEIISLQTNVPFDNQLLKSDVK